MSGYASRVKRDIDRWQKSGLVDTSTATRLARDIDENHRAVSFGAVLSTMAAVLFSAAILLIVAANWEELPRLARVGLLFALIAGGYVGGAVLKMRGRDVLGECAFVIAATAFGASTALIAQMYHLSGDETQAILVWCIATGLAAAALRSGYLNVGAVLLAAAWYAVTGSESGYSDMTSTIAALAIVAALYLLTFWTKSAASRHLAVLSVSFIALIDYAWAEAGITPLLLGAFAIALLAYGAVNSREAGRITGLGNAVLLHALIAFLVAVGMRQFSLFDEDGFLLVTIIAFVGIIAALILGGRQSSLLRWFAYAAFIFQLCFLYLVMLGSMLDTAGFFIVGGLVLSALAFTIGRLEKRFGKARKGDAA